jgi:transcriptional regulator with XRE-family HTH domain
MLIREQLGGVMRDIRTSKAMTLGDVTKGARISVAHLSELERGRTEPSSEIIRTLADFYNVSQADIYLEVGARMSASDQLNGRFDFQDLTTLLYGAPIDSGFDQAVSLDAGFEQGVPLESMPDFNNVMPSAPDHLPDELVADELAADVDSVRTDS